MVQFRRKLYKRGSSVETTIPKPLLFALDERKKHDVIFNYDPKTKRWYVDFEENDFEENNSTKRSNKRGKKR